MRSAIPPRECDVIRAIIKALSQPRNRFGKLDGDYSMTNDMQAYASSFPLPHGGVDTVDQARMLLLALIGDPITELPR